MNETWYEIERAVSEEIRRFNPEMLSEREPLSLVVEKLKLRNGKQSFPRKSWFKKCELV